MKKVTAFVGSGHKKLTDRAVRQFLDDLQAFEDVETELVTLSDYRIGTCRGCRLCFDRGEENCPMRDDRDVLIGKIMASDGVVGRDLQRLQYPQAGRQGLGRDHLRQQRRQRPRPARRLRRDLDQARGRARWRLRLFLNKTKCRRKDIIDMFLGTGAGPHAYSIIEQGMVTRIIESKPEELRGMFEEAAGVSRYKERRRETENRIKHTRENLSRVEDIRKELETQLNRLQRQSRAAQRYKEMKQEERTVRAQLLSLRWRRHDEELRAHDGVISAKETELEAHVRNIEQPGLRPGLLGARQ